MGRSRSPSSSSWNSDDHKVFMSSGKVERSARSSSGKVQTCNCTVVQQESSAILKNIVLEATVDLAVLERIKLDVPLKTNCVVRNAGFKSNVVEKSQVVRDNKQATEESSRSSQFTTHVKNYQQITTIEKKSDGSEVKKVKLKEGPTSTTVESATTSKTNVENISNISASKSATLENTSNTSDSRSFTMENTSNTFSRSFSSEKTSNTSYFSSARRSTAMENTSINSARGSITLEKQPSQPAADKEVFNIVIEVNDLPKMDSFIKGGSIDPYFYFIDFYLDKKHKYGGRNEKRNDSPKGEWKFPILASYVRNAQKITIKWFDFNNTGKDDEFGTTEIDVSRAIRNILNNSNRCVTPMLPIKGKNCEKANVSITVEQFWQK